MYHPALHKWDPKLKVEGLEYDTGSDFTTRDWTVKKGSSDSLKSKKPLQQLLKKKKII